MINRNEMRIIVWFIIVLTLLSAASALAGNNIVSQVKQFRVNNIAPEINLISPSNNARWINSSTVIFSYNTSDYSDAIANCSLYVNNAINASNESIIVQNQSLTINLTLANGEYNWSIHCFDRYSKEGISESRNISVAYNILSINLLDSDIEFGTCTPEPGTGTWFDSNDTTKGGSGIGLCSGLAVPQNITVENDGSVAANVTIQIDSVDLAGNSKSQVWFATQNPFERPGCFAGLKPNWINFTSLNTPYIACEGLNSTANNNLFWTFIRSFAPSDSVVGSRIVTFTYTAHTYE
jgi:hypothetical protein